MNQPPPPNYVIKACPTPPPPPRNQKQTSPTLRNQNRTPPPPPLIKTLLKALYVGRKASPLQLELGSGRSAYRGTYREWLRPKISKFKIKKIFPRNNFSLCFMLPWSLWAENIFSVYLEIFFSDRKFFKSQNILKVFLETTLVHVSCSPDHYEPKIFFWFSKFATTLRYTILDSRFSPENAISEGRPPLCNTSSEAGALDTGGTYREWLGPKIF